MTSGGRPTVSPSTRATAPPDIGPRWRSMDCVRFIAGVLRRCGSRSCFNAAKEAARWGIMNLWERLQAWRKGRTLPEHLRRGRLGERAARRHLRRLGLKFLAANFRSARGEIDLVCRDRDCLVFVEVKTRSSEGWR